MDANSQNSLSNNFFEMKELKFLIIIKKREEETKRVKKPKGRHDIFLGCNARVILSQALHHRELRFR